MTSFLPYQVPGRRQPTFDVFRLLRRLVLLVDSRTLLFPAASPLIWTDFVCYRPRWYGEAPLVANVRGDFAEFLKRPSFVPFVFFTFPPVLAYVTGHVLVLLNQDMEA